MNHIVLALVLIAISIASATGGWVFRDARARGLPMRKALTWAVISTQEFPLIFLLYRRIRPRRVRGEEPSQGPGTPARAPES
jgi:hypothetical protein